jgi:hypothetical protein
LCSVAFWLSVVMNCCSSRLSLSVSLLRSMLPASICVETSILGYWAGSCCGFERLMMLRVKIYSSGKTSRIGDCPSYWHHQFNTVQSIGKYTFSLYIKADLHFRDIIQNDSFKNCFCVKKNEQPPCGIFPCIVKMLGSHIILPKPRQSIP